MEYMYKKISELPILVSDGNYSSKYPRTDEFVEEGVAFIRANNLKFNTVVDDDMKYISTEKHNTLIKGQLKSQDVLITVRGELGKVGLVPKKFSECNLNAQLALLRVIDKTLNPKYVLYAFKEPRVTDQIIRNQTGTTLKQLPINKLKNIELLIQNKNIQDRIVNILDKAQSQIDKRNEQINLLDELVKSKFIEIFGNPATNPKGWNILAIGDITTDVRYGTSKPAVDGGKYPYLRMNNITYSGYLDLENLKFIDIDDSELEKCVVRKGDMLFNRTNSAELIGKTCVFDLEEPMIIAGYIIRVRLIKEVLPIYLSMFLNSGYGKGLLKGMAKGAVNQANINAQELKSIKIAIPPIELQNQFVDFVKQVDKLKFNMEQGLKELEDNFNSLMQKAFKGELFN